MSLCPPLPPSSCLMLAPLGPSSAGAAAAAPPKLLSTCFQGASRAAFIASDQIPLAFLRASSHQAEEA